LRRRLDPSSDALLAFPVFLTYQIGLLASRSGGSGVDFITNGLVLLCSYSFTSYLALLAVMLFGYAALLSWLRHRGNFDPRRFVPTLLEAGVYALAMGSLILFVLRKFVEILPLRAGDAGVVGSPIDILVISAGAGFHEELVFRLALMGGLIWLFRRRMGAFASLALALSISSLLFAAAHHGGAGSEAFTLGAFAYRSLAGIYFGVIYAFRGFAVAVWTHALYDLYVLSFTP